MAVQITCLLSCCPQSCPRHKSVSGEDGGEHSDAISKEVDMFLCYEASLLQPDSNGMGCFA